MRAASPLTLLTGLSSTVTLAHSKKNQISLAIAEHHVARTGYISHRLDNSHSKQQSWTAIWSNSASGWPPGGQLPAKG
jgi:hypothetical protein